MPQRPPIENLDALLDRLETAARAEDPVTLRGILTVLGRSSFGPLVLLAGLVTLAPVVGDVPGVPTLMAVLVVSTSGQLLFRREHVWLPAWLLERSLARRKVCTAIRWSRRPARLLDRWIRPRLARLVDGPGAQVVAAACVLVGVAMPVMELVPFSANLAGAALTAFGLSLTARDGLLALVALGCSAGTLMLAFFHFS